MTDDVAKKPTPGELAKAIEKNDVNAVEDLLKRGAPVNKKEWNDIGHLGSAAARGFTEIVALLIAYGANVNEKGGLEGITPLMRAVHRGRLETARVLIQNGADVNARMGSGVTPLMLAAFCNELEAAWLLMNNGADIDAHANNGDTALTMAESANAHEMVQLLKEAPARQNHAAARRKQQFLKDKARRPQP